MNFTSDNAAGIAPEILAALAAASTGAADAYGADPLTTRVERRIAEVFEAEVAVFLVATGTAANALALATVVPPWGAIYCHREAHVNEDECGAPEFFSGGAKLVPLAGANSKIHPAQFQTALAEAGRAVHNVQPAAVSLSQASEAGTVYSLQEIHEIAEIAHGANLVVHMDGARLANALVSLDCTPAEITWKAGIDILSLGATKNGALAAEAVVVFNRRLAADLGYRRKRSGHLLAKMRFLAAQFDAYLTDGLWLRNARHANAMAARLADGLKRVSGAELRHPVDVNEVFVNLPERIVAGLNAADFRFHLWSGQEPTLVRLVCAFDTRPEEVDALLATARQLA
jgi:threonine aldolase